LRAWLAVAGGIETPLVMGSRSTYRRAGIGGHQGRALAKDDMLDVGQPAVWADQVLELLRQRGQRSSPWSVRQAALGNSGPAGAARAVRGPEWDWFTPEAQRLVFNSEWRITAQADRMGARLEGPVLELVQAREMISAGVTAGVVQVPATGQPIVLLASRQSVGGYPRLAVVASAVLGLFAQARPGDMIRLEEITLAKAQELYLARERDFETARAALAKLV
jgi:antagonist of KipI